MNPAHIQKTRGGYEVHWGYILLDCATGKCRAGGTSFGPYPLAVAERLARDLDAAYARAEEGRVKR